jgi:hypothetical protein
VDQLAWTESLEAALCQAETDISDAIRGNVTMDKPFLSWTLRNKAGVLDELLREYLSSPEFKARILDAVD